VNVARHIDTSGFAALRAERLRLSVAVQIIEAMPPRRSLTNRSPLRKGRAFPHGRRRSRPG